MRSICCAAAAVALSGCALFRSPSTPQTEFFVLSAIAQPAEIPSGRPLAVGIGPVSLPAYLARPEMVRRVADNQLVFDEFTRWAEPLKSNFEHVLATDLDILMGFQQMTLYPWYDTTPLDYAVGVAVLRFERQSGDIAALSARWSIRNRAGAVLVSRESQFSRPAGDPAQTAAALSAVTADLAGDIAAAMRGLDAHPH
jgi:uncharacterized lipoprotein YmbA